MIRNGILYGLALLMAFGLKYHYSRANADDLVWILGPTSGLVEVLSGIPFEKEIGAGYINREYRMIIAPACAGVNFLIAAFCVTICSFIHKIGCYPLKYVWIAISCVSAYLVTLIANASRILLTMLVYQSGFAVYWLTSDQLHRLEGIVVYVCFLCVYYAFLNWLVEHRKTFLLPMGWYLLVTLLVPLLNPMSQGDNAHFAEHAFFVLAGCVSLSLCFALFTGGWRLIAGLRQKKNIALSR